MEHVSVVVYGAGYVQLVIWPTSKDIMTGWPAIEKENTEIYII